MKLKTNFIEWVTHYSDILEPEYDKFFLFFKSKDEEPPSYESFVKFVFLNTKKFKIGEKLIAPIY